MLLLKGDESDSRPMCDELADQEQLLSVVGRQLVVRSRPVVVR